jgi:glycosyltransferase A (GT-A) superfamily protein (DUF2064 family)
MQPLIAVFAKAPRPGFVKTRLGLDPEMAARLHESFVRDALALACAASDRFELHTDVETDAWSDIAVPRRLQAHGDLGERMLAAFPSLILGSDAPSLPLAHLKELIATPGDVVLGPAEDGGYWAILARRTHERMFEGVEWSTSRTREQTIAACRACSLSVALGSEWFDADEPTSLRRLVAQPDLLSPRTRSLIERLS